MSSVAFVRSTQVVQKNQIGFFDCPKTMNIPCENIALQGVVWGVPVVRHGIQTEWDWVIGGTQPTADSIKALRIYDKLRQDTYWIPVDAATGSEATFVDFCNACCGDTPVMPTVVIPAVIIEECPCPVDVNGTPTYTHRFGIPANPNTRDYLIAGSSFNGVAGTPAPAAGGYANLAAVVTFLNTNIAGYGGSGTWSLQNSNKVLQLVSTTAVCAGIDIDLEVLSYCFEIPGVATPVNGIRIGGVDVAFPQISFSDLTASSRQAIVDAIQPYLVGTVEVVEDSGDYFLKYTGVQVPNRLNLNGAAVAGTTFSTGACP